MGDTVAFLQKKLLSDTNTILVPITGVVRELGKLSGNSNGLTHTYFAKHHFASMFDDFRALQQNLGGRSAGKGRTDRKQKLVLFAKQSRRYSGVFQGDEIRIKSSYQQLGKQSNSSQPCLNFSQNQYETRKNGMPNVGSFFQRVPEPFDETRRNRMDASLVFNSARFQVFANSILLFWLSQPAKPDCWADTNGCAAGNTLEEAILQGFMELVERDSVALWWYNRNSKPRVDLESFDEPYFQDPEELLPLNQSRNLWVSILPAI